MRFSSHLDHVQIFRDSEKDLHDTGMLANIMSQEHLNIIFNEEQNGTIDSQHNQPSTTPKKIPDRTLYVWQRCNLSKSLTLGDCELLSHPPSELSSDSAHLHEGQTRGQANLEAAPPICRIHKNDTGHAP